MDVNLKNVEWGILLNTAQLLLHLVPTLSWSVYSVEEFVWDINQLLHRIVSSQKEKEGRKVKWLDHYWPSTATGVRCLSPSWDLLSQAPCDTIQKPSKILSSLPLSFPSDPSPEKRVHLKEQHWITSSKNNRKITHCTIMQVLHLSRCWNCSKYRIKNTMKKNRGKLVLFFKLLVGYSWEHL